MKKSIKVACCYSHKDSFLADNFKTHLSALKTLELITIWDHSEIAPGANWEKEINEHLESAQIILLLISPDFIASEHCQKEIRQAQEQCNRKRAYVIPIILRPTNSWEDICGKFQALPSGAKAITLWNNEDAVLADIVKDIKELAETMLIYFQNSPIGFTPRDDKMLPNIGQLCEKEAREREESSTTTYLPISHDLSVHGRSFTPNVYYLPKMQDPPKVNPILGHVSIRDERFFP